MRALVVETPGVTPVVATWPEPMRAPGRSLVRVTAAPVVPLDLLVASGTSYFGEPETPYVPGVQGVGRVEESDTLPAGTQVFLATTAGIVPARDGAGDGALAERCVVADDDLVALDGSVADTVVAALGLSAVAAWQCLVARGRLRPGEHVAVLGAGGAVGQAGIGVAYAAGAGRVVAVCREASRDRAREAGAQLVVTTDDTATLADRLREACGGRLDVVLDPVCGAPAEAALAVLSPGGRLVNLGGSAGESMSLSSAAIRSRSLEVHGYTNAMLTAEERADGLRRVVALAADDGVRVAHLTCPLEQAPQAWEQTAQGTGARVVVTP